MSIHRQPRHERWRYPFLMVALLAFVALMLATGYLGLAPVADARRCPRARGRRGPAALPRVRRRTRGDRRRAPVRRRPLLRHRPPGLREPGARQGGHAGDGGGPRRVPASGPLPAGCPPPWRRRRRSGTAGGWPRVGGGADVVVDLGAGTGHHLARVLDALPDARGIAHRRLPRRPPACRPRARAGRGRRRRCVEAAPLRDGIATIVLSVFAPRNAERDGAHPAPPGRRRSSRSRPPRATSTSSSGRSASCRCPTTRRTGSTPSSPRTSRSPRGARSSTRCSSRVTSARNSCAWGRAHGTWTSSPWKSGSRALPEPLTVTASMTLSRIRPGTARSLALSAAPHLKGRGASARRADGSRRDRGARRPRLARSARALRRLDGHVLARQRQVGWLRGGLRVLLAVALRRGRHADARDDGPRPDPRARARGRGRRGAPVLHGHAGPGPLEARLREDPRRARGSSPSTRT